MDFNQKLILQKNQSDFKILFFLKINDRNCYAIETEIEIILE